MLSLFAILLIVVPVLIHLLLTKKTRNTENIIEIILFWWICVSMSVSGFIAFYGHIFMADKIAASIGWPTGNPFQAEVAVANLAFAILAFLSFWFRENFWVATAVGQSSFLLGAAVIHINEAISKGNFAINNVGPILFIYDLLLPIILLALVFAYKKIKGF